MSSIGNSLLCLLCAAVRLIVLSAAWDKGGRFKVRSLEDTSQQVDSDTAA
jgi:hypothetical protein